MDKTKQEQILIKYDDKQHFETELENILSQNIETFLGI
jgi:hypothetical protein